MSTYLYLTCLSHNPPLRAPYEGESGQHLSDLPQIQLDLANRYRNASDEDADLGYFRNNTARFLRSHPLCNLGVEDEYGQVQRAVLS